MAQPINIQDSITVIPSGYSTAHSSYSSISSSYPVTNGYTDSSSTNYAYITCNTGSQATTYISYTFDFSDIPSNATINSITAKAKLRVSSTSYLSTAVVQLYNGTTAMGSSVSARTTTATVYTISSPGTWTRSTLNNLEIRYTGTRGTSNTTRAAYLYFYGADITVNYSVTGTQYTLTATSEVSGVTIAPTLTTAMNGESVTFLIQPGNLTTDDFVFKDNDVDKTSSLVYQQAQNNVSLPQTAESLTTGFSGGTSMNFYTSSSSTGHNFSYAVGHTAESPGSTSSGSGSWTYVKDNGSSTSNTGYADFIFDFDAIPSGATINSVQVKCYGAVEDTSQTTSHADITLFSGSTQKGTMQKFTSTSNSVITISDVGTWTAEELHEAKLRFAVGYYGGHIFGITWTVVYSVPGGYTYTLTNMAADHEIVIEGEGGPFIPPDEDPAKDYFPITISSINATTNPENGTTRVEEGTNQTITITPSDPQLTLALDNGVDITNQLTGGVPNNTYSIATASGASYGFTLNSSTGYYTSTNAGQANSAAVARVSFNLETACTVTFTYINYAEATYDYGIFGNIDTALGTTYTADSNTYLSCSTSTYNKSTAQTLTYTMSAGTHFIDVKYRKDSATNSYNDNLQFKVDLEATGTSGSYSYTLTNINQKHSLIFIFGNVSYYFITSSGSNAKLYPEGQIVVLQGNDYHVTIVPDNASAVVTLYDNNTNVTSSLQYEEGTDKNNNKIVNYTYYLTNVNATHNLVATCAVSGEKTIYVKINGTWTPCSKVYRKINGSWVEQSNTNWTTILPTGQDYKTINLDS